MPPFFFPHAKRLLCLLLLLAPAIPVCHAQSFDWRTFAGSSGGYGIQDGIPSLTRFFAPQGVAVDAGGTLYTADTNNHSIRCTTRDGRTSTFAGQPSTPGSDDGPAGEARFRNPRGIAFDPAGSLIVADSGNHVIRRISRGGAVTTLAGSPGLPGSADGPGAMARFNGPRSIAVGQDGTLYIADSFNQTIRRISPGGLVSTLAGAAGAAGSVDGPGPVARFRSPRGVAVLPDGMLLIADTGNQTIRRLSPAGEVSTLAGLAGNPGSTDGHGHAARFRAPTALVADPTGQLYVADSSTHSIRRINAAGEVTTLAGADLLSGFQDGEGDGARFNTPSGLALTPDGRVIVADTANQSIRALTPAGSATTLAGGPRSNGSLDGPGPLARFRFPTAIAGAPDGSFAIADEGNHTIRKVSRDAQVSTLAGRPGIAGMVNGALAGAAFRAPAGLCYDRAGSLYIGDTENRLIRLISPAGEVSTLAGTFSPLPGAAGIPAYAGRLVDARGIAVDHDGRIYVTDHNLLRRLSGPETFTPLAGAARRVTFSEPDSYLVLWPLTVRGNGDGTGASAVLYQAKSPVCDAAGNLYFADAGLHTIRRCTPEGIVTTLAGKVKQKGFADGTGEGALFSSPTGLTLAPDGTLYVADSGNHVIRRISRRGVVTTVGGLPGEEGTGEGSGSSARFANPTGLTLDASGALLVADRDNHRIVRGQATRGPHLVVESALSHLASGAASHLPGLSPPGTRSQPARVILHNTGPVPLRLDRIFLDGGGSAHFSLAVPDPGTTLEPDASLTLTLDFLPPGPGSFQTTLVIQSQDPTHPDFRVHLTGTGNTLPRFSGYSFFAQADRQTALPVQQILDQASDAEGHPLSLTSVDATSLRSATVWLWDGKLYYNSWPGQSGDDSFSVTITDPLGGQITVVIGVRIITADDLLAVSSHTPVISRTPEGGITLTFVGTPGLHYRIQRSTALGSWNDAATVVPSPDTGLIQWTDPAPPADTGFYRLSLP